MDKEGTARLNSVAFPPPMTTELRAWRVLLDLANVPPGRVALVMNLLAEVTPLTSIPYPSFRSTSAFSIPPSNPLKGE